MLERYLF